MRHTARAAICRLWTAMPKPTYRIDVNRVSFVVSPNNRKHSSAKQMPSKSSFIPIISPIRPILLLTPERNSRWKCSIDTVLIRSCTRIDAVKWCKALIASGNFAIADCKRATYNHPLTQEFIRGRSSVDTDCTPDCPSSNSTSRTSSLLSMVRGAKTS